MNPIKTFGRALGVGLCASQFALGLWIMNNVDEPWVIVVGVITTALGITGLGAVSDTIRKDTDRAWN